MPGGGPLSTSAIYAEPGSARAGDIIVAKLEGEEIGRAAARSDGSYLVGLRTYMHETLADTTISLDIYAPTGGSPRRMRAHIATPAPLTLYVHGATCSPRPAWTITSTFSPGRPAPPIEEALAIDMRVAGQVPVEPPALDARFTYEVPVEQCANPWMLFARHEDDTVSGCWEVCGPEIPRESCGGCTKLDWAAGRCDLWGPGVPDAGVDAGPPDAGSRDAGPDANVDASID